MLVITRKRDERIIIEHCGEIITIIVNKFQNGNRGGICQVQLGIEAPQAARICREEIYRTITKEKQQ